MAENDALQLYKKIWDFIHFNVQDFGGIIAEHYQKLWYKFKKIKKNINQVK